MSRSPIDPKLLDLLAAVVLVFIGVMLGHLAARWWS